MLSDDARYKILKKLESNPDISQRQLAEELGVSLIKAKNFSKSQKRPATYTS